MGFFFLAWLGGSFLLVRAFGLKAPLLPISLLWLLVAAVAVGKADDECLTNPFFEPIFHAGTHTFGLLCAGLLFFYLRTGRRELPWILAGCVFMAQFSDLLFLITFVVPAAVTLGVLTSASPSFRQRAIVLLASILPAAGAGYFAPPYLYPIALIHESRPIQWNYIPSEGHIIWTQALKDAPRLWVMLFSSDVIFFAGALLAIPFLLLAGKRPLLAAGLIYVAALIGVNWGTAILCGAWGGMYENRYVLPALLAPTIAGVLLLHGVIRRPAWVDSVAALLAAGLLVHGAYIPQGKNGDCLATQRDIPFLQKIMAEQHITAGLGDYWYANICTALSHGTVPLRCIDPSGNVNFLFQSKSWFGIGQPPSRQPHFRIIWAPNPDLVKKFGAPDQIYTAPSGLKVWTYSEAHALLYDAGTNSLVRVPSPL
jgi:hypothetical protein